MKPQILITDQLFISASYVRKLEDAGFVVERLNKVAATEEELIEALKGKVGYILGGTESVTSKVLESTRDLKVIAFTGADWAHFIVGHETATAKGIVITNTPGTTAFAVAEFTLALMLMMVRHALELGGPGEGKFLTSSSLATSHIGIVGMGWIGAEVSRMLTAIGAKVSYWDRNQKPDIEMKLGVKYLPLKELVQQCDVISNHVSSQAGELMTTELINSAKENVLFINTGGANTFNMDALFSRISKKSARAAFDIHGMKDERFKVLPLDDWYCSNENTAYNTQQMLDATDAMATDSVINVLKSGGDKYIVNNKVIDKVLSS